MCVPGSDILTVLSPDINAYMHACIQILWRQLIIGLHLHTLLEMAFSFPAAPHWYHKKHGIIGAVHRLFFCISLMYIYIFCNQSAILWPITVIKSRQDPFSVIWRIYKRNRIFKEEKSILRIWNWLDCEKWAIHTKIEPEQKQITRSVYKLSNIKICLY